METQFEKVIQEVKASNKAFPNEAYDKYKLQFLNALRKYGETILPSFQDDNMQLWNIGDTEGNQDIIIDEDGCFNSYNNNLLLTWVVKPANLESANYLQLCYSDKEEDKWPYTAFFMHLHGDVRANYSQCILLPYNKKILFDLLFDDDDFRYYIKSDKFDIYYEPLNEQSVLRVQGEDVNDEISTYKTKQELLDEDIPEEVITAIQEDPLFGEDIRDE